MGCICAPQNDYFSQCTPTKGTNECDATEAKSEALKAMQRTFKWHSKAMEYTAKKKEAAEKTVQAVHAAVTAQHELAAAAEAEAQAAKAAIKYSKAKDAVDWSLSVQEEKDAVAAEEKAAKNAAEFTKEAYEAENNRQRAAAIASSAFKRVRMNANKVHLWLSGTADPTKVGDKDEDSEESD